MTKQTIALLFLSLSLFGCDSGAPTKAQYKELQKELDDCKKTVADLQNTPQQRLAEAQRYSAEKNYSSAAMMFQDLIDKFPGSEEAKTAKTILNEIKLLQQQQKEVEEKKKTLGFKALNESSKVIVGDVQLSIKSIAIAGQYTFDRYGDEYHYRNAERGNKFVVAKVSVAADSKNPDLPPISVFKMSGGQLSLLGTLEYKFVKWNDYGSYLGNYADYGNDFAHTSTISFSCGLQASKSDLDDEAVFVVVKKANCFTRNTNRFGNPPVSYNEGNCNVKQTLTLDDFDNDYTVVKIFNKGKL